MIYNDLVLFSSVARHLSFSGAAREADIPLSKISRRIAELEENLGVKLFERTTRKVRLTEEGKRLLDRCQAPLEELQTIAGFSSAPQQQLIRITAPPLAARDRIGPLLLDFAEENPGIRIDLITTNTKLDFLRDNIDLAFRLGPLSESSMIARKLWSLTYSFCCSPEFATRHNLQETIHRDRLLKLPALTLNHGWLLENGDILKTGNRLHVFDDLELIREAVDRNLGVALLPDVMLSDRHFKIGVTGTRPASRDMFAVYPSRRLLPMRIRTLIDFMVSRDK
ncbi:LysR family transcriptional regulator [Kiloniella sp. b19]|uniref:LysR family transcriptional regulator n=1 Tax=Kiloniella sp. GXU_MW_B19 TaxID=3141326 RepID=UPI0031E1191E